MRRFVIAAAVWGSLGVLIGFVLALVASLLRLRADEEGRVVEAATGGGEVAGERGTAACSDANGWSIR